MARHRKDHREVMTTISISVSLRNHLDRYKREHETIDKTIKRLLKYAAKMQKEIEEKDKTIKAYNSYWKQHYEENKECHEWKPEHPNRIKIVKWFIN